MRRSLGRTLGQNYQWVCPEISGSDLRIRLRFRMTLNRQRTRQHHALPDHFWRSASNVNSPKHIVPRRPRGRQSRINWGFVLEDALCRH